MSKINIRKPRRADIIAYKNSLVRDKKAINTIDSYLTTVRRFFEWLELHGIYDNIAAGVHVKKRYRGLKTKYLNLSQIEKLLNTIPQISITNIRNYAIMNLMLRTGIRRIEVSRLNTDDIHFGKNSTISIIRKGQIEKEEIGVTNKITSPILKYIELRGEVYPGEPLFINHSYLNPNQRLGREYISRMIKRYLMEAGLNSKEYSCHSLRHSAAINALKNGASLYEVQELLGHRLTETTQIYLSAIKDETRLINPAMRVLEDAFKF